MASILHLLLFTSLFVSLTTSSDDPQTFIIHVSKSQKPKHFTTHKDWYASILKSLQHSSPTQHQPKILYSYERATRGFSASLTLKQAESLGRISGIISVVPDQIRHLHTTRTPSFLQLSENSGLWANSGFGEGVIIGVLDTGIWPGHRSFSDIGFSDVPSRWKGKCVVTQDFPASACNKKLIGARAFFLGYLTHLERNDIKIESLGDSLSPRDTEGHGTHTASTAGGNSVEDAGFYVYPNGEARGLASAAAAAVGNSSVKDAGSFVYAKGEASGMASRARLAVYKVCWEVGCFDSDILAAIDQAIQDGVDVLSMSLGATGYAPQYDQDSISIGAFSAVQHGIIVSCSAGNSGPGPYTAVNIAPWIITVGASTIDREFPADVILGDNTTLGGVSLYTGEPLVDFKLPLVYGGDCGSRYCYISSLDPSKVRGKIVLCDRGGNARVEKGSAVKLAGGLGMILANTEENGEELIADSHLIPATMVGEIAGNKIRRYIGVSRVPTATIQFRGTVIGSSPPSPKVAAFSSRGPNHLTPDIIKPDVIAPGVNILAAWTQATSPTDLDIDSRRVEFNIISGTSMSCPHVSGIAALLRKAYPDWSPAAIKSALVTTAYGLDNSGNKIKDLASNSDSTPFTLGAGHVDPNRALDPGLIYDIDNDDYIAFLCSIGYDPKRISVFIKEPISPDICSGGRNLSTPGNLNYPSFSALFNSNFDVVKYKRVVKNVGSNVDAIYEVKVNSPDDINIKVSPSKLVFGKETTSLSYEIEFSSIGIGLSSFGTQKFGAIEWSDGVHRVRSPIAFTWRQGSTREVI